MPRSSNPIIPADRISETWRAWCGDCKWTDAADQLGAMGGLARDWGGCPQSASAIPLTFELFLPNGVKFPSSYRLKDIRAAVEAARSVRRDECPE